MAEPPLVAALLLNWRLPDMTLSCLADLLACSYSNLDVLVMDNGSEDESAARLQAEAEGAEVVAFPENVGYCKAMNYGLEWARERGARYVLFLNNDMSLPHDFLEPLVEVLTHDPDVAGVGPTMLSPDGRVWCEGGSLAFHPNMLKLRGQGRPPAPPTAGPIAVDFIPGACVLYRLEDLTAIGDLEEDYFMYWEDVELGWRLRDLGKKILWLPWSRVTHVSSASSGGGRSAMRKYMSGLNSVRYLRRHGTVSQWCAFLVFECLLWPFTWVGGTSLRSMMAKGCGIWAGLLGRRVKAADVVRWS